MDLLNILAGDFNGWCSTSEVKHVFQLVRSIVEALRIIVPIGLILMTALDISKKVINPNEKDGQKKIMTRAIAAVLVFLIPTMITILFRLVDAGKKTSGTYDETKSSLLECWGGNSGL